MGVYPSDSPSRFEVHFLFSVYPSGNYRMKVAVIQETPELELELEFGKALKPGHEAKPWEEVTEYYNFRPLLLPRSILFDPDGPSSLQNLAIPGVWNFDLKVVKHLVFPGYQRQDDVEFDHPMSFEAPAGSVVEPVVGVSILHELISQLHFPLHSSSARYCDCNHETMLV